MELKESLTALKACKEYKDLKKSDAKGFLSVCFQMMENSDGEWQFGFMGSDSKMTTFIVSKDGVQKMNVDEVFKKPDDKVIALVEEDMLIESSVALSSAKKFALKNYPKEVLSKEIILLQNLPIGQVYNITFLTMSMSTLNVKLSSKTGEILQHSCKSLIDFAATKKCSK